MAIIGVGGSNPLSERVRMDIDANGALSVFYWQGHQIRDSVNLVLSDDAWRQLAELADQVVRGLDYDATSAVADCDSASERPELAER